jgi:Metallopeptidase family M24
MRPHVLIACILSLLPVSAAQAGSGRSRERHAREWESKAGKMEEHLLRTMRKHGVDMWILMSRENHPDPILDLFGGYGVSGWYGHRNAYIFHDTGADGLEATVIGTHLSSHLKRFYPNIVSYGEEGLAHHLGPFVRERDPKKIAVNRSRTISMADGLTSSLESYLLEALSPAHRERIVSSEPMAIDYISYRTDEELEIEREASFITYHILRRAFSNEVITPGTTTLMDVYWWIVDEWKAQDLEFNFPPGLDIQRRGVEERLEDHLDPVIQPGDLLHVDFGVRLMGLVTDQQKMAYVLQPGETQAPKGLLDAFAKSQRLGEIILEELEPGVAGHVVKERSEERGTGEGIISSVYNHSQGNWVHDAGAWTTFDWPERYGQHPREPVRAREIWSIEYSASLDLPEWDGQRISMLREEDAWVDEGGVVRYFAGPQEELWLIRTEQ